MSTPAAGARGAPGASGTAAKPVLFVTGHVPGYRVGALARLHERAGLEVARFGGSRRHGGPDAAGSFPSRYATRARASCMGWRRAGATGPSCAPQAVARPCWRVGPGPGPGAYR